MSSTNDETKPDSDDSSTAGDQSIMPRLQFFVDQEVQGAVVIRVAIYGVCLASYFAFIQLFTTVMNEPSMGIMDNVFRFVDDAIYGLPALLLLCPLAVHDLLKLTNRFAGPVHVLRRELKNLIEGNSERPIDLRDGDYWKDVIDQFNTVREELLALRAENTALSEANAKLEASVGETITPDQVDDPTNDASIPDHIDDSTDIDTIPDLFDATASESSEPASEKAEQSTDSPVAENDQSETEAPAAADNVEAEAEATTEQDAVEDDELIGA